MSSSDRLTTLLDSLGMEIVTAQAGSSQGQFPILDLLGNLRDQAEGKPELAEMHRRCADAWERMVQIVESGNAFTGEEINWLNDLLTFLQKAVRTNPTAPAATTAPPVESAPVKTEAPPIPDETGEEAPLVLNISEDAELLREFIMESREHLDNIEQGVLVLENQPADAETLNTVFRAFHTFKGGAGFLNLLPINRLAHVLESLLDLARQGKLTINAPVIELILRGRDVLKQFLDEIEGQVNGSKSVTPISIATAELKTEVQSVIDRVLSGESEIVAAPKPATPKSVPAESFAIEAAIPAAEAVAEVSPQIVPTKAAPAATEATSNANSNSKTDVGAMVKVDTAKLDGLLDLVGEMVIAQSLVGQGLNGVANLNPEFARNMAQLGRITKELQRVSMSLRMVPIRGVFQKMARVVRDVGAKQNKKVQFVTSGEDTELDRGVVEELNDPLLHMIRNSMDHGIESSEKREAAGKSPTGTLHLRAYHQGGNIVVEIEDDGAGLNKERILQKAIERGLTAANAPHTDEEIFNFIFAAGFSTAEKITDLSGRGVGLDVVRRNIEKLRGRIDISSSAGKGTLFKITLPLTLAIIDGLIVKVGEERYILPTLSVRESFRPEASMITRVQGRGEVVKVRDRLIPLLRLHELFGIKPKSDDVTGGIVIVIQSGPKVRCLLVDSLLHKQEVVIKNLNDMMVHKNRALAGAAILGDGRVGLILDMNALVHLDAEIFSQAA
ncbi:MAG TPA: chemotaxis protein CheA [Verrucomicrobiae bacterium]|nr:chemotaxis protein CheA [Verrucomicrobiae bacterium]